MGLIKDNEELYVGKHKLGKDKGFVIGAKVKIMQNPPGCDLKLKGKIAKILAIDSSHHIFYGCFPGQGVDGYIWFQSDHLRLVK